MAGGFAGKFDPKNQKANKAYGSEVLKDSQGDFPVDKPAKISLKGILGLGQTVEINKKSQSLENQGKQLFSQLNHLEQEQTVLFDQHQLELKKTLEELRSEIHQLAKATDNLEKDVENVAINPVSEASEYQINFLNRIKNFISNFRKNISEAGLWVEAFASKKKKRNLFWNNVKDKKKGGDQYLFSNEHSAARSVS